MSMFSPVILILFKRFYSISFTPNGSASNVLSRLKLPLSRFMAEITAVFVVNTTELYSSL
ncbi:UNVERIFIED_ORG: hypothetical protein B5F06_08090 [Lacrimispora saccharolytica]|nr:hypothetical protein CLOM621_05841 [Clostridium sp. M62/1]RHT57107.1 hypothetical protein DW757_08060 [Clostridium sp. AM29-11AC]CBL36848.1 hypothetical protein CL3_29470 [butyrate-producing bacterium SM4/1]